MSKSGGHNFLAVLLVGFALLTGAQQVFAADSRDCRSLIVGRTYAGAFNGFLNVYSAILPNAGAQYLHFNADGTVTGSVTFSLADFIQLSDMAVQGTYNVESNASNGPCSGKASVDNQDYGIHHDFQFVVSADGNTIEFFDTSGANPQNDLLALGFTGEVMKLKGCSNATLSGAYIYNAHGWISPPVLPFPLPGIEGLVPFGFSGVISFDGQGNFTGWDWVSLDGVIPPNPVTGEIAPRTYTGTYTVTPDCVSMQTMTDSLGQIINTESFVLKGGNALITVNTDPGTVVAFKAVRTGN